MHDFLLPSSRAHRLFATRRHPDQAALLARIPGIGRRVPLREYWRRQPIKMRRAGSHMAKDAGNAIGSAGFGTMMRARSMTAARRAREATSRRAKDAAPRLQRRGRQWGMRPVIGGIVVLISGAAIGLLGMYYLDPHQGRRRRALVRDKVARARNVVTRELPERVERRGRFFRGVARGVAHHATDVLPFNGHAPVDDETLVARVRSEVLRDQHLKAGEIHIDSYQGCVTLRGQLERPEDIKKLVRETAHVEGVREVRNFLHLPGTVPPNKAEVYSRYEMESPSRR